MIQAAIFDMDGLLVNSEPHWRAAERAVFDTVGLFLTDDQCKQTTGMPVPAVVAYWYARQPWPQTPGQTQAELSERIIELAHRQIGAYAEAMPGAVEALRFFAGKHLPTAIASASPMEMIETVINRLGIRSLLTRWHSATLEAHNKPAPDVYIGTARLLGFPTYRCLAFEDSGSGVQSATAAGCPTVAVPADFEFDNPKFDHALLKLPSLTDWSEVLFDRLQDV